MNKLLIGSGLAVLAMYALGTFLLNDTKPTNETSAQTPNKIVSVSVVHNKSTASPAGSRIAYLDPETGELTSKSADPLESGSSLQAEVNLPPVKITTYSDGTVQAELNGRFRTPLMATIGCDGELATGHSDHLESKAQECGVSQ